MDQIPSAAVTSVHVMLNMMLVAAGPMQYMAHMPNPAQQHRQQARSQVQPQLPAPAQPVLPAQQQVQQHQQQQRCCARVMPMIPTPGSANHSQSLQGTSPEAIQMAVADILDRSCQVRHLLPYWTASCLSAAFVIMLQLQ